MIGDDRMLGIVVVAANVCIEHVGRPYASCPVMRPTTNQPPGVPCETTRHHPPGRPRRHRLRRLRAPEHLKALFHPEESPTGIPVTHLPIELDDARTLEGFNSPRKGPTGIPET